jgi:Nuclear pore complex scaffold, nucleoporins 186/192/205
VGSAIYYEVPHNVFVTAIAVEPCSDIDIGGEFDRLTRDNMTTINSYGSNLMDIVCRDACDGHDVGRVGFIAHLENEMEWIIHEIEDECIHFCQFVFL